MVKTRKTVCVVGSGFMGSQIGLQCAANGYKVIMNDISSENRKGAAERQREELGSRVAAGTISSREKDQILGSIEFVGDLEEAAGDADFVLEAIPERLELKRRVFTELDRVCAPHTIVGTNSSSIRISKIEDVVKRRDRVLNMHFYPPVWERPVLELMRGTETSDETIEAVLEFARGIGMTPLTVQKESTGFLFNRVWRAIKKETLHLVDQGVASCEDVDRAWMIVFGQTMGPFGLMDLIGLDVVRDIELVYHKESGDDADLPPKLLLDMIERGELGVKSGRGFYSYPHPAFQDEGWLKDGN